MKLHTIPTLAGAAVLTAATALSGCAQHVPGHPEASSVAAPTTEQAPPAWETGANPLARIGGPDTQSYQFHGRHSDRPRPDDPQDLLGQNWPGNAAGVYDIVGYMTITEKLTHDAFNRRSRATAGEVVDTFLALNGGRVAASLGVTPEVLAGKGVQAEVLDLLLISARYAVRDAEVEMSEIVEMANDVPRDSDDKMVKWDRGRIADEYARLTTKLARLGPEMLHNPKVPLPERSAAGAQVYAAASPSGQAYAVNPDGRPAQWETAPADAPAVYPLPPLRPTPGK